MFKKIIISLLCAANASMAMQMPLMQASQIKLPELSRMNAIPGLLTNTKLGKLALASCVAYGVHRGVQHYTRTKVVKTIAAQPNTEQVIRNPKGVVTLFAHGLGADRYHGEHYKDYDFFAKHSGVPVDKHLHVFDFQDSPALSIQLPSCLGQAADVAKLKERYDALVAQGYQVNLHGVSRGASTIVNFLGLYQPKNVRCAVAESPFDDLESIVKNKLIGIKHIPLVGSMVSSAITALVPCLPFGLQNYSVYGINPRDVAHRISKNTPLLFLASKQDALIPHTSTQKLVQAVPHSYSMIADKGPHANILQGNPGMVAAIKRFVIDPSRNPVIQN